MSCSGVGGVVAFGVSLCCFLFCFGVWVSCLIVLFLFVFVIVDVYYYDEIGFEF